MRIQNFDEYESAVLEYRTPGAKNKNHKIAPNTEVVDQKEPQPENDTISNIGKEAVKLDNFKDFENKPANANPSRGRFAINPPVPGDEKYLTDVKHWSDHVEDVYRKIRAKKPFFVEGEAGWGKTSVITQLAKKCGYTVIVLYCDKMAPEDLGGLPVSKEDKTTGEVYQIFTLPPWAQYMHDHPETQFMLFLDEVNQTTNAVMKALMPVVLEHTVAGVEFDNFFCAGAGNLSFENDLEDIPIPLMSRLGGAPIAWLAGTETAWTEAFNYLHKKWDSKIGKKLVSAFEAEAMKFASPRDIEKNIFEDLYDYKMAFAGGDEFDEIGRVSVDSFARNIKRQTLTVEGRQRNMGDGNKFTPEYQRAVDKLARLCYDFVNDTDSKKRSFSDEGATDNSDKITDDALTNDKVKQIMTLCVEGTDQSIVFEDGRRIPVTHETILEILEGMSKEFLNFIDSEMKKKNLKWKYPSYKDAVADKSRNSWKTYDWQISDFE